MTLLCFQQTPMDMRPECPVQAIPRKGPLGGVEAGEAPADPATLVPIPDTPTCRR